VASERPIRRFDRLIHGFVPLMRATALGAGCALAPAANDEHGIDKLLSSRLAQMLAAAQAAGSTRHAP